MTSRRAYLIQTGGAARRRRLGARVLAPRARRSPSTRRCARSAAAASRTWSTAAAPCAARFAERLRDAPGVAILNDVVLNQVLVRSATTRARARDARRPGRRHLLAQRHHVARRALLRISVCNWRTTFEDVDRSVAAMAAD